MDDPKYEDLTLGSNLLCIESFKQVNFPLLRRHQAAVFTLSVTLALTRGDQPVLHKSLSALSPSAAPDSPGLVWICAFCLPTLTNNMNLTTSFNLCEETM